MSKDEEGTVALKPCPFCGGQGDRRTKDHYANLGIIMHRIGCRSCLSGTHWWPSRDVAVDRWNKRVADDLLPLFEEKV